MMLIATFLTLISAAAHITDDLVAKINDANAGWIASTEQGTLNGATSAQIAALCGVDRTLPLHLDALTRVKHRETALPESFDAREQWPKCPTISQVRDQSACGSCWAFSSAEAMSDRLCIHSNATVTVALSAAEMNSCCTSCGNGCNGGTITGPWSFWRDNGLVSSSCSPYTLPSCDHHVPGPHPCPKKEFSTPRCVDGECTNSESWTPYFGATAGYIDSGEAAIMAEIFKNGPVQTAFTVYEDFPTYKSGVYKHTTGAPLGGHAVEFVGWGVEGGQRYWLVKNSWNRTWGAGGFFKILRGVNECGIEDMVTFGLPKL